MNLFLRAKHWQLFLLMVIPIFIGAGVMMYYYIELFRDMKAYPENIPQSMIPLMEASMWMMCGAIFSYFIYALWMWAVNMKLRHKLSSDLQDSSVRFNVVYAIPIIYMLFVPFFMYYIFYDIISGIFLANNLALDESVGEEMIQKGKILFPIYFCLYLLYIPSFLYLAYRTGKTLKKLETRTEVSFGDCFVEILLVLFFPLIGVWFLQSKVNTYADYEDWDEDNIPPPAPVI